MTDNTLKNSEGMLQSEAPSVQEKITSTTWPGLEQALDFAALSTSVRPFIKPIIERLDLPKRLAKMALMRKKSGGKQDAHLLAQAARTLAPNDIHVRHLTAWLTRWNVPLWHFRIIHDRPRNEAYSRALTHFVKPGMTVFEIGTGTGILAMLAARAGASHVYTCERRAEVAEAARAIIARNHLSDRITVIAKDARDVRLGEDIPERADLFVAEIVDDGLLGESVLPLTELAVKNFLKPGAILLPRHISAMGCIVSGRNLRESYRMDEVMGFDLTPFNRFSPLEIGVQMRGGDAEPLSETIELIGFDLNADAFPDGIHPVSLPVNTPGTAAGVMKWLRLDFGDGIFFENCPSQQSSWAPHLHILPDARPVKPGDIVEIEIHHEKESIFLSPRILSP